MSVGTLLALLLTVDGGAAASPASKAPRRPSAKPQPAAKAPAAPSSARPAFPEAQPAPAATQPLDIWSDRMTLQSRQRKVTWTGNVHAIRHPAPGATNPAPMHLRCLELVATYGEGDKLERAVCTGDVQAVQGDRAGWGQVAVYEAAEAVLTVTGEPRGQQGANRFRGERLRFFLDDDRVEVDRPAVSAEGKAQPAFPGAPR